MKTTKELLKLKQYHEAFDQIEAATKTPLETADLLNCGKYLQAIPREHLPKRLEEEGYIFKKVAFLSGYTSQYIRDLTAVSLLRKKIIAEFFETEYGLYEQAIYSEDQKLLSFKPDVAFFCVGTEHLNPKGENEAARWISLYSQAHQLLKCDIITNTFEEPIHRVYGHFETRWPQSTSRRIEDINHQIRAQAPSYLHLHDTNFLASYYGRKNWRDEKLYDMAKIPVAYDFLPSYAESLSSVIAGIFGKNKKCLVLDLDNTLWGGVIGDDGLSGIEIGEGSASGEAHKRFQSYIKQLKDRGVILAVCSKNEETNAKEPFLKRKEMILKLEDISCFVANWEPKSTNIAEIARRLNIGLDSFVFVDDNPAEREIVRRNLPQVAVIELPEDPSLYTSALSSSGYFNPSAITNEDLQRTEQYLANSQREMEMAQTSNYADYLKSLKMMSVIAPFDASYLPRIAQLINKTNQFNVTTRRYSESEVHNFSQDPQTITRYVRLRDKFGDNGLISVLLGSLTDQGRIFQIDTWLMSCRVLKRGVENFLFRSLLQELVNKNTKEIHGLYLPTEKNKLVENLFKDLGFTLKSQEPSGATSWIFDVTDLQKVQEVLAQDFFIDSVLPDQYENQN